MVKKRPRVRSPGRRGTRVRSGPPQFKLEPAYWRRRLFRNTFTYRGDRRHVLHWSVKIQHLGQRKSFSLQASDPNDAAREACRIYRIVVTHGWDAVPRVPPQKPAAMTKIPAGGRINAATAPLDRAYWMERLIQR